VHAETEMCTWRCVLWLSSPLGGPQHLRLFQCDMLAGPEVHAGDQTQHVSFGSKLEDEDFPRDDISIVRLLEILLTTVYKGS
jgi:hypothetical protein